MTQVPLPFPGDPKKALEPCASQASWGGFVFPPCIIIHGKNTVQYAHAIEMLKKLILKGKNSYLKHKINH